MSTLECGRHNCTALQFIKLYLAQYCILHITYNYVTRGGNGPYPLYIWPDFCVCFILSGSVCTCRSNSNYSPALGIDVIVEDVNLRMTVQEVYIDRDKVDLGALIGKGILSNYGGIHVYLQVFCRHIATF